MAPHPLVAGSGVKADPLAISMAAWQVMRRGLSTSSSPASSGYPVVRISSMMNEQGDFNGTCTKEEAMTITPETPDGSCTSYFADVTDYCCAAVGGVYNATFQEVGVPEAQAMAFDHPICTTSNYADMLSCYQYVTESHCSATSPVPYGVCNKNGTDTSRATQRESSAAARADTKLTWRRTLTLVAAVACSAIQLVVNYI